MLSVSAKPPSTQSSRMRRDSVDGLKMPPKRPLAYLNLRVTDFASSRAGVASFGKWLIACFRTLRLERPKEALTRFWVTQRVGLKSRREASLVAREQVIVGAHDEEVDESLQFQGFAWLVVFSYGPSRACLALLLKSRVEFDLFQPK